MAYALPAEPGTAESQRGHRRRQPSNVQRSSDDFRLVGPLDERVGADKTLHPGGLQAAPQRGGLLEQRLHLGIGEGQYPVEHAGDFECQFPTISRVFGRVLA